MAFCSPHPALGGRALGIDRLGLKTIGVESICEDVSVEIGIRRGPGIGVVGSGRIPLIAFAARLVDGPDAKQALHRGVALMRYTSGRVSNVRGAIGVVLHRHVANAAGYI